MYTYKCIHIYTYMNVHSTSNSRICATLGRSKRGDMSKCNGVEASSRTLDWRQNIAHPSCLSPRLVGVCGYGWVFGCVCVREREREREAESEMVGTKKQDGERHI